MNDNTIFNFERNANIHLNDLVEYVNSHKFTAVLFERDSYIYNVLCNDYKDGNGKIPGASYKSIAEAITTEDTPISIDMVKKVALVFPMLEAEKPQITTYSLATLYRAYCVRAKHPKIDVFSKTRRQLEDIMKADNKKSTDTPKATATADSKTPESTPTATAESVPTTADTTPTTTPTNDVVLTTFNGVTYRNVPADIIAQVEKLLENYK